MKRKALLMLLAAFLPLIGHPFSSDATPVPDARLSKLQADPSFAGGFMLNPYPETDERVEDFTVMGDRIYYLRNLDFSARKAKIGIAQVAAGKVKRLAQDAFPSLSPGPYSFHSSGNRLYLYDNKSRAMVELDPRSGRTALTETGFSTVGSFGRLGNGMYALWSSHMLEFPVRDFRALEGLASDEQILHITTRYKNGRIFLVKPDFSVAKVVKKAHDGRVAADSTPKDRFVGRYQVRVDRSGSRFAVFSKHLPGIEVYSAKGELMGRYEHPGQGRVVEAGTSMTTVLPAGTRFMYQTDVILEGRDLLVSDPASRRLWQINTVSGESGAFDLPGDVVAMHRDGPFLYLLELNGHLSRYFHP